MSIFKCKMCGGTLEINAKQTTAVCEYCQTQQTLPKLDDEKRANLYDRANHFRRNNEFDKAMSIYENILNEDGTDAEAYWSLVLCRYGIEYVEDPASHKRVPTVNRAQFTSIFDDDNYKSALQYADGYQKAIYEQEATAINEIQKGILAISQKEEPFDVFICYKETDQNGRRTQDSVLANDLYYQLAAEGFKVFFSRITLEDKLGVAYEPYIFAALNSAKVMVVLGTKPEYFNAVWVKNEWSRYLALVKQTGGKKILIPAYRDMDPYDLPEEFSHLQAQDMGKLGFMQDLIRGIKKLAQNNTPKATAKETVIVNSGNANITPLLKRAFMFLEDRDWKSADEYCEKVLDQDPENAQAYLGKLMAELHVPNQDALCDQAEPFDSHNNYQKALRFADDELKTALISYIDHINTRNENARRQKIYQKAKAVMESAQTEADFKETAKLFGSIYRYQDADILAKQCYKKAVIAKEEAENARKDQIYKNAKQLQNSDSHFVTADLKKAVKEYASIPGWKDADEQLAACKERIRQIEEEEARKIEADRLQWEKEAKKIKKIAIIAVAVAVAITAALVVWFQLIIPNKRYNEAVALMDAEQYEEAIAAFEALDGYKDSETQIQNCETAILDGKYNEALVLMESGKFVEAYEALIALDGYKDSAEKAIECRLEALKVAEVGDYVFFGAYEQDNNTSNGKEDIEWLVLDKKDGKVLVISKNALDCQPYDTNFYYVTWETCTLRKWLNGTFWSTAFSEKEKEKITTVTVSADKNPDYSIDPGKATEDKVFLLSITEVNKYFDSDSARQCEATVYAKAQGADVRSFNWNCWWWLRSPGRNLHYAVYVSPDGDVFENGYAVGNSDVAVRPALWIDLES